MRRALAIGFACALLTHNVAGAAIDSTRVLEPPAEAPASVCGMMDEDMRAGMCDGFEGLAFTFCVALCEARDCDLQDADDERCTILRRGFARVSGGAAPPCGDGATAL